MEIKIKKTNVELTPDVAAYLDKKLEAFEKFIEPTDTTAICEVEIGKVTKHHQTGAVFFTEINLSVSGARFRAVAEEGTLTAAIDRAKDGLLLELGRNKKKRLDRVRRSGAAVKAMLKGIDFTGDIRGRTARAVEWGKKEFRGYWPFK
ncbi:hypothetical protein A2671_00480 [Candidatus Kaiserbacteria bacterium RIFCSPHIGHO2_01_FULL_49_13]|uniref:Ribosomal subunit interface protein n=1 Tax=Candidatus Kaiserbacteria bacterium RIFCSPHIGHO2_01_FULL_49_13 TaxID=1798477 RepID=A0A1F6CCT4_9BACT|nr:MAG: hypothetical protein A2671_00480 [Candidatus Kaiserbacteria bacterium RIFCSPHIGHO2_01_FULL_49_13]